MNKEILERGSAYRYPTDAVAAALGSDTKCGLTTTQAGGHLQHFGRNELARLPPIPVWRKFLAQFWDPLPGLLLIATLISCGIRWIERVSTFPYEAMTIAAIVLLNRKCSLRVFQDLIPTCGQ